MCDFILYIFLTYARVRTRSLAIILAVSIRFALASFFMSAISFFSCRSRLVRSRSMSRMLRLMDRWYSFMRCAGVFEVPNNASIPLG